MTADRLLIVLPTWVGDSVMATPVLRALRSAFPNAHITAAVRHGVDTLLAGCPWCDDIFRVTFRGTLGPFSETAAIRARRPDTIVLLPNSLRSALGIRFAGAARRIGYARDRRGFLLTHAIAPPSQKPISAVDYYAQLVETAFDIRVTDRRVELLVTPEEARKADALLAEVSAFPLVLNPGANNPSKRWKSENFAAVARRFLKQGRSVVVSGGPKERELVAEIVQRAPGAIDLIARGIDLGGLKGVLARAACLLTNDTGPRHIAAALRTPVVTLFGPTDHRWTTLVDVQERLLLAEPFLTPDTFADRHPQSCVMDRIAVGDAIEAISSIARAN
ncbi:MAG: lipopolysaccharide heptosyltransferase II [Phycisphaerales bacterium]|nr:lipopolysaccharide heptosyltransferase II [Phycisphaerales bacterium]